MNPTAKFRPAGGLVLDIPANSVGGNFYTGGRNVAFPNGFVSRIPGSRIAYPVSSGHVPVPPWHARNLQLQGLNFWLDIGADEIWALEGSNFDDVTPVGGLTAVTSPEDWSSDLLNGIPIVNNGREPPQYWLGDVNNPFATLTDWPEGTVARSIAVLKYHVFAFDIDTPDGDFGSLVRWSAAAEPGTIPASWTPSGSNDAGSAELSDTPGRIMMGLKLNGLMAIYKEGGIYFASYVGAKSEFNQEVFNIQLRFGGIGAWSRRAAADCDDFHMLVTDGDIVRVTTTNVVSGADARTRSYFQRSIDANNYRNLYVVRDRARRQVWICFPEAGSIMCTQAIVWDQRKDTWGIRDLVESRHMSIGLVSDMTVSEAWDDDSGTWDSDPSVWNTSAGLSTQAKLVECSGDDFVVHDTDDVVVVDAYIAKHDMDLDYPEIVKTVSGVRIGAKRYTSLHVRVGVRDSLDEDVGITWSESVAVTSPMAYAPIKPIKGRYISVEISSNDGRVWEMNYFGVEFRPNGKY